MQQKNTHERRDESLTANEEILTGAEAALPNLPSLSRAELLLPTTLGKLYSAVAKLWKVTVRDDPDYSAIEDLFEKLKPYDTLEFDTVEAPSEIVDACNALLSRKISTLESSALRAAAILGEVASPECFKNGDFDSRLHSMAKGFSNLMCCHASKIFTAPSGYDGQGLPSSLAQIVSDLSQHLMLFGMVDRGFTAESFEKWFRAVSDVWTQDVFPRCLQTDSDGSEYFFGDLPTYYYSPDLDKNVDLHSLNPDLRAHSHLGYIQSALTAYEVLAAEISVLRDLTKRKICSFLDGGVLIQELCKRGKYSPSLSFRKAQYEGAPGIELAFHQDHPVYDAEKGLGFVNIRFLDENTPIIVTCQGISFSRLDSLLKSLRISKEPKQSPFIQDISSIAPFAERRDFFQKERREACSAVGVRQATEAAILAAIILLRELGFNSVLGVSDTDQHALLDLNEINGSSTSFYDPLFARLGFRPPELNLQRFWRLPLEQLGVWNGDEFMTFQEPMDYFATVLSRQPDKDGEVTKVWDSTVRLADTSKQLIKFRAHLLHGAEDLAAAIKAGSFLRKLAISHRW